MVENQQDSIWRWKIFVAEESSAQVNLLLQCAAQMPDLEITRTFLEGKLLLRTLKNGSVPDALILNLCMLDMDALDFLNQLQAIPSVRWMKILVTTGGHNQNIHERLLSLGADYYMIKPYNMAMLFDRIRLLCQDELNYEAKEIKLEELICARLRQLGLWQGEDQGYMYKALYKIVMARQQLRMVEDVYSAVAREAGVSLGAVDASLRRTLKEIERANTPDYQRLLLIPQSRCKKMTVGTFLNMIGQQIQREYALLNGAKALPWELPSKEVK